MQQWKNYVILQTDRQPSILQQNLESESGNKQFCLGVLNDYNSFPINVTAVYD